MAQDEKTIYVYENWRGEAPTLLGRLRCGFVRCGAGADGVGTGNLFL